jgi:hypothetical protein
MVNNSPNVFFNNYFLLVIHRNTSFFCFIFSYWCIWQEIKGNLLLRGQHFCNEDLIFVYFLTCWELKAKQSEWNNKNIVIHSISKMWCICVIKIINTTLKYPTESRLCLTEYWNGYINLNKKKNKNSIGRVRG